jgi:UDP-glucuronate 4-epimerase
MALFLFTRSILAGEPINVFNYGHHRRDFTFIDDIAEGVVRCCDRVATGNHAWDSDAPDPGTSRAPYRLYNIGNNQPVELMHLDHRHPRPQGRAPMQDVPRRRRPAHTGFAPAELNLLPLQQGDVPDTWADIDDLQRDAGYTPATPVEVGIGRFVEWYRSYYGA